MSLLGCRVGSLTLPGGEFAELLDGVRLLFEYAAHGHADFGAAAALFHALLGDNTCADVLRRRRRRKVAHLVGLVVDRLDDDKVVPVDLSVGDAFALGRLFLFGALALLRLLPLDAVHDVLEHAERLRDLAPQLVERVHARHEYLGVLVDEAREVGEVAMLRLEEVEHRIALLFVHDADEERSAVARHELSRELDDVDVHGHYGRRVHKEASS